MAKNRLNIILGVDVKQLERQLSQVQRRMKRFASSLQSTGQTLTQSLTIPLAGVGFASLAAFGDIEKLEKGLAAILGPTGDVRKELDLLRKAAEAPGLDFEQAVKGSIQLQAVGFSAEQARESISALGTAVALTSGGAEALGSVVKQITQINAKGRILQEDLGIIQEAAPGIGIALKEAFGTQTAEGLRALNISTAEFTTRLTAAIQNSETFQGVTGGLANAFENFRNNIKFALAELGRTISETVDLESVMNKLSSAVSRAVDFFKSLTPEAQRLILITAAVTAAIGPVLIVLAKLATIGPVVVGAIKSIVVALRGLGGTLALITSPITLITLGIVALIAVVVALNDRFIGFRKVLNGVIDFFIEFYRVLVDVARPIGQLVTGLGKFFTRDFAGAAASITAAFQNEIPSISEVGGRLGNAFAGGFADETNRIEEGVKNLKKKIFKQVKEITEAAPELLITPTAPTTPTGRGGGEERQTIQPFAQVQTLNLLPDEIKSTTLAGLTEINTKTGELAYTTEALGLTSVEALNQYGVGIDTSIEAWDRFNQKLSQVSNTVGSVLSGAFEGFFEILEKGGTDAFQGFVQGAKKALIQLVKQLAIALAKAIAVAAVMTIIFPGSTAAAGGFKGLFKNLFSGFVGLATGGIIPPGYPNDTFPARLSSGEAVIPLDKLNQYTGGGNGYIAETRLSGEDLVILMKRAEKSYNRFS